MGTTARGPLRPSPPPLLRPRLMLIPTTDTTAWATMVLDTVPTDTVSDTTDTPVLATTDTVLDTTARGPLRPSPPLPLVLMLRLIPTTATTAMDTDTVLDTTSWIPRLRIRSWPLRLRPWSLRILRLSVHPSIQKPS